MARGHWLDPLARSLLEVTGQLPRRPKPAEAMAVDATAADDPVERDLLELKLRQDPQRRLHDPSEVRLAAALGWRLDVNRASADDRALIRLLGDHPAEGFCHFYWDPPALPFARLFLDGFDHAYIRGRTVGDVARNALARIEAMS
jgi:hypothetical protein